MGGLSVGRIIKFMGRESKIGWASVRLLDG